MTGRAKLREYVKCFRCDKPLQLRADDTYPVHGWTTRGVKHTCEHSGQIHNRHSASFRIVTRNPNRWLCECLCGESFIGGEYDDVDRQWVEHRATSGLVDVPTLAAAEAGDPR